MRKTICLVLTAVILLGLTACGSSAASSHAGAASPSSAVSQVSEEANQTSEKSTDDKSEPETVPESELMEGFGDAPDSEEIGPASNILVVYFSRTGEQYNVGVIDRGNTAVVAEMIAEATDADIYEILPAEDTYPMTYEALTDVALEEQRENARPAIAGELPDLSGYDTVFIGAPVWWGDWPMICYTFFESADLSGKTVYPFSTHAGSGLSGFDNRLRNAVPGCTVGQGFTARGTDCQNDPDSVRREVENWLSELG